MQWSPAVASPRHAASISRPPQRITVAAVSRAVVLAQSVHLTVGFHLAGPQPAQRRPKWPWLNLCARRCARLPVNEHYAAVTSPKTASLPVARGFGCSWQEQGRIRSSRWREVPSQRGERKPRDSPCIRQLRPSDSCRSRPRAERSRRAGSPHSRSVAARTDGC